MSKRKFGTGTSYSSLRRQVAAQVNADLQFLDSDDCIGDVSADNYAGDAVYHTQVDPAYTPVDISDHTVRPTEDIVSDDNSITPQTHSAPANDFIDCHWVDSDTDVDDEDSDKDDLVSQVNEWANKYRLPHVAVTELMHILKPHLSALPNDSRTLLHTPRSCNITHFKSGGDYCHLGLAKGLQELLKDGPLPRTSSLELQFNIDGMPLFKSSNLCLWPILCLLKNAGYGEPFVVGIYHGKEKPADAVEFLLEFVGETSDLMRNGVNISDVLYSVNIHSFVCDAPARSFVKGVKCHSGYSACEKCVAHGEYCGKVIYRDTDAPLRTDVAFDELADEEHHSGPCPLKPLPIGYVSQFGLDYMHLVCLGVVRRLLLYWKGPVGPLCVRLGSRALSELSQKLVSLCPYVPCEFARRPRSISEVMRWKATEFRQFLLYTGPVCLRGIVPENLYNHFMLLSVGIRILACPKLAVRFCDYANELLVLFVSEAEKYYGKDIYVYNVHCLIHLANDVKRLGPLDNFSSFPYENKLGQLKKMIRKPQFPIQQIVYRLAEKQHVKSTTCNHQSSATVVKTEHSSGPVLAAYRSYRQYRCLKTKNFKISLSTGNNCILTTDGSPALVENILTDDDSIVLICQHFASASDAISYPLQSSRLGMYKVSHRMTDLVAVPLCSVTQKCVMLPLADSYVVFPLLH